MKNKSILTFRDDEEFEKEKHILAELFKAMDESRFVIVILSKNYASSKWCLEEFAKIVSCMKET